MFYCVYDVLDTRSIPSNSSFCKGLC